MYKRIPIKNPQREIQLVAKRSMVAIFFMLILVLLLILRLAYLQIYRNHTYATLSTQNWLDLVPIEPTRGLIYDRNGIMLAENIPVFSLDIIPFKVKDLTATIRELRKIISITDNDVSQLKKQRKQHRRFDEITLKLRLNDEEVARFVENQHRFPGVQIKARLMRHYPYGASFSHVMGYVGRINSQELNEIDLINYSASHYIGKIGIEKYYEEELHGKVGYQEVENDASGKSIRILKEIKSTPGKNIYLTIESDLQLVIEKALGDLRGAAVAIEPETGQVLAMVSNPGFDPNLFVTGINQKEFQTLQQSELKPLYNRALRGLYPPASTIKPYLALEGLNAKIITPETTIYDQGSFQIRENSHVFHDWWRAGHQAINVSRAIFVSCDIFFYELANKLGIERMDDILTQFGFGSLTGIDIDDELPGVVASPAWKFQAKRLNWYEGDTILSGIGQGYMQATPLQLAQATAILANRGKRFMPYLLLGEQMPGEAFIPQPVIPLDPVQLQNEEYWDVIIHAMQKAVDSQEGTAHKYGKHPFYTLAAKTGTAQVTKRRNPEERDNQENLPEKLRDHHLFIAFAPVDKPKIAIAIITENSNKVLDTAHRILDYYLGRQNANRSHQINIKKANA